MILENYLHGSEAPDDDQHLTEPRSFQSINTSITGNHSDICSHVAGRKAELVRRPIYILDKSGLPESSRTCRRCILALRRVAMRRDANDTKVRRARERVPAGGTPVLPQKIKGSRLISNARARARTRPGEAPPFDWTWFSFRTTIRGVAEIGRNL